MSTDLPATLTGKKRARNTASAKWSAGLPGPQRPGRMCWKKSGERSPPPSRGSPGKVPMCGLI